MSAVIWRSSAVLAGFLGAGAAGGALWERWWTPTTGIAFDHRFVLDGPGLQNDFASTGLYVALAITLGGLVGFGAGLTASPYELLTLALAVVGAVAGGWLMNVVGHSLGPPDAAALAKTLPDLTQMTADLSVAIPIRLLVMPIGALVGLVAGYLIGHRSARSGPQPEPPR